MKKIMLGYVFLLVSMSALKAQEFAPSPEVAAKFAEQFKDATNVSWTALNNISLARFNVNKSFRVAYYDQAGELIAKGRRIAEAQLPMNVYEELQVIRSDWENKSGKLAMGGVYEFLRQSGETEYMTTLENNQIALQLSTKGGNLGIRKKTRKNIIDQPHDLIAKAPY